MVGYLTDVWRCRYFWMSLVKMDLRTRYRRSVLGLGWSLLHPIAMTIILCLVFGRIFHHNVREYAPYLLAGLACWDFIHTVTLMGCSCFFQGEPYIRQFPAPLAIYPLRTALGQTIHFLTALVVVVGLAWIMKGFGNLAALPWIIPSVLLLVVFAWALALLAGFATVFFQDTQHLCDVGFRIFFYATPIIYRPEILGSGKLAMLMQYNPLVPLLQLIREPILYGQIPRPETYLAAAVTVSVALAAAVFTLARLQRRLIFHL